MLAAYGVFAAYAFGLLMNLSGWPFLLGIVVAGHEGSLSYVAGAPVLDNLHTFLVYTLLTSTGELGHHPGDHERGRDRGARPGDPDHAAPGVAARDRDGRPSRRR